MKKLAFILLFFHLGIVAFSQIIKGTISDKNTKDIIDYASVYINGTFIGTYTDENGNFELDISKNPSMPISISAIGYYSVTIDEYSISKPIIVFLEPKIFELQEVVIKAKAINRQRRTNMVIFRNEFLGTTDNGRMCDILNEEDITFNYGSDKDTLKAYTSKPILIENRALGYKITYYLDAFEFYRKDQSFFFKGNIIFTEDLTSDESKQQFYTRKRQYAYIGSRMHFFRMLWTNSLGATGFVVMNPAGIKLNINKYVFADKHGKYMKYGDRLNLCYYSRLPTSSIIFLKDKVHFYGNGYYDPSGILWEGRLAMQRVGDWLPYEYIYKK